MPSAQSLAGSLRSASADEGLKERVRHRSRIDCVPFGWMTLYASMVIGVSKFTVYSDCGSV